MSSIDDRLPSLKNQSENVLVLLFLVMSTYMYIESSSFRPDAARFPRWVSLATVILCVVVLARNYLPEALKPLVTGTVVEFGIERGEQSEGGDQRTDPFYTLVAFIAIYLVLSFMVSLMIATPIFALLYGVWFRQPWYKTAFLVGVSVVLVLVFIYVFNTPLDQSYLDVIEL